MPIRPPGLPGTRRHPLVSLFSAACLTLGLADSFAAEPTLWARPSSDLLALDTFSSYYAWDIFTPPSDPVFQPDVTSFGPDGALLTGSGNYIVTSTNNLYGLPGISISLPGYEASSDGYTTIFLQTAVVAGSAGTATNFQLIANGSSYSPQVNSGGGLYFQIEGRYSTLGLTFSASVDHTSVDKVAIDTYWSMTAPDLGSLSSGGTGLPVVPGGAYSSLGFGYTNPVKRFTHTQGSLFFSGAINEAGTAIHTVALNVAGASQGQRAVSTNANGDIVELANLGTNASGVAGNMVASINDSGLAVGQAEKVVDGADKGYRAVLWNTATGAVTELPTLGISTAGSTTGIARDINASGAIAGRSLRFSETGQQLDNRAVRWEAGTLAITDLGIGDTYAINNAGTVVGISGSGSGARPARWDAGSATPVIIAATSGLAMAIGESGVITGFTGSNAASTPVRWDPGSTTPTPLEKPASFNGGVGRNHGLAVDDAGNIVGFANRYTAGGGNLGDGAVLWKIGGTAGLALDTIGVDASGNAGQSVAFDINNAGYIVGTLDIFDETKLSLGFRAVVWNLEGDVVDLNTLIDPGAGWTLIQAQSITDSGWISGVGSYSSVDGTYERSFSIHAPQFAVPEPGSAALAGAALVLLGLRRKRRSPRTS